MFRQQNKLMEGATQVSERKINSLILYTALDLPSHIFTLQRSETDLI